MGGIVIRRRSADALEDFYEKLIVASEPFENADLDFVRSSGLFLCVGIWPRFVV